MLPETFEPRRTSVSKRDDIADELTDAIESGELAPGSQLPSEHTIKATYGVSRLTARSALHRLADDGLVTPQHGRGWYVRHDHRRSYPLLQAERGRVHAPMDVWHTWLAAQQLEGSTKLTVSIEDPPQHVQRCLGLQEDNQQCATRRRVHSIEGRQALVSVSYFPMHLPDGRRLAANTYLAQVGEGPEVDLQSPSALGVLHHISHEPVSHTDIIGARRPTRSESGLLRVGRGSPVITVRRTSRDAEGNAVRCTLHTFAGDQFVISVEQDD